MIIIGNKKVKWNFLEYCEKKKKKEVSCQEYMKWLVRKKNKIKNVMEVEVNSAWGRTSFCYNFFINFFSTFVTTRKPESLRILQYIIFHIIINSKIKYTTIKFLIFILLTLFFLMRSSLAMKWTMRFSNNYIVILILTSILVHRHYTRNDLSWSINLALKVTFDCSSWPLSVHEPHFLLGFKFCYMLIIFKNILS